MKRITILPLSAMIIALGVQLFRLTSADHDDPALSSDNHQAATNINIFLDMTLEDLLEVVVAPSGETRLLFDFRDTWIETVKMPGIFADNFSREMTGYAFC